MLATKDMVHQPLTTGMTPLKVNLFKKHCTYMYYRYYIMSAAMIIIMIQFYKNL
jgi:hypothetical protein